MPSAQSLLFPDPRPLVERLGTAFFRGLTERPGVYLMLDASGLVLYVGKAKNLRKRLRSYRVANPDRMGRRQLRLLRQVERIDLQECADEAAALAREAELLLELKPKFNRAGVWPATPRFLRRRWAGQKLELTLTETAEGAGHFFGPFGGGILHLRAALARLLWLAWNPVVGSAAMPAGWVHGRLGELARIAVPPEKELDAPQVEAILTRLFAGDGDGLQTWVSERTQTLSCPHDLALRDADLETVSQFLQARARRTRPFTAPDPGTSTQPKRAEAQLPWGESDGNQP